MSASSEEGSPALRDSIMCNESIDKIEENLDGLIERFSKSVQDETVINNEAMNAMYHDLDALIKSIHNFTEKQNRCSGNFCRILILRWYPEVTK